MSATPKTCPTCRGPVNETRYRPFCSKRCADVDLQRWFAGTYAVPAVETDPNGEDDGGMREE